MSECLVSEDGFHSPIDTPSWEDEDGYFEGGMICKYCGEELE